MTEFKQISLRTKRDSGIKIRPDKLRKQPPALTTMRKDRTMAERADITPALIRQLIRFEGGKYYWNPRSREMFNCAQAYSAWTTKYENKETLNTILEKGDGYFRVRISRITFMAHRVIWALHYGEWPKGQIDHINGIRTDNRIENLRDVSHIENGRNQRMTVRNTSGHNGVGFYANKWRATITINRKTKSLGSFDSLAEALIARKNAESAMGYHQNHGKPAFQ